jgi:hypothetical protein
MISRISNPRRNSVRILYAIILNLAGTFKAELGRGFYDLLYTGCNFMPKNISTHHFYKLHWINKDMAYTNWKEYKERKRKVYRTNQRRMRIRAMAQNR